MRLDTGGFVSFAAGGTGAAALDAGPPADRAARALHEGRLCVRLLCQALDATEIPRIAELSGDNRLRMELCGQHDYNNHNRR